MSLEQPIAAEPHAKDGSNLALGYFYAGAGAILFSIKAVIVKLAYGLNVDPETLLALRLGLSLPFYLGIGYFSIAERRHKLAALPSPSLTLRAALIGMLGYWIASYTDFLGLVYIGAQFERLILLTYPFFVVLFGAMFFGETVKRRAVIALSISYLGLALIFGENFTLEGHEVAIGAMGPRLFTCIAMLGATAASFVQFFIGHGVADLLVSREAFVYSLIIAVGATVLPTFFMSAALHRISAQANATIGILSPISTIVLAAIVLGERLTPLGISGTALVIAGVAWFTLSDRR